MYEINFTAGVAPQQFEEREVVLNTIMTIKLN